MAKKAAKRGKTRSRKARKKVAGKSARKTAKVVRRKVRRKAAKKTAKRAARKTTRKAAKKKTARRKGAKKAAPRRKAAKKTVRRLPKRAAKKAAKTKRPAPRTGTVAKPPRPAASQPVHTPTFGDPGRGTPEPQKPAAPAPQPRPSAPSQTFLAGHFDPGIERYYTMLAQNTPEAHRLGTAHLDKILAANPKDIMALSEKGHDLVNNWRNGVLSPDAVKECKETFGTDDIFAAALRWAQRSIASSNSQNIANPHGYWVKAYAYKYQGEPKLSAENYRIARSYPARAFLDRTGRRKKDLDADLIESLIYWAKPEQLRTLVDKIEKELQPAPGKAEAWMNWVKCFALHLMRQFEVSNALYPDQLPADPDVNLIIAANHARLGNESQRQFHRRLFLEKDGNGDWSADKEIERSPFVDKGLRDFWHESVRRALQAEGAPAT
jgi:hypothetical protein